MDLNIKFKWKNQEFEIHFTSDISFLELKNQINEKIGVKKFAAKIEIFHFSFLHISTGSSKQTENHGDKRKANR